MIEANLSLVVSIARRYQGNATPPLLNLIQEGNLGLVSAVRALDGDDRDDFSAIAASHAERAIVEAIAAAGR